VVQLPSMNVSRTHWNELIGQGRARLPGGARRAKRLQPCV
jgi:hypothetical protein